MITIADAGMGNIAAIANMLDFLEIDVEIRKSPDNFGAISHLILPGVGSFDAGMELLQSSGWAEAITSFSSETKILGICLGMQLLMDGSEEGKSPGLGLVAGKCKKFDSELGKVPHMGWNNVDITRENSIFASEQQSNRFYFAHSYYVELDDPKLAFARTNYQNYFVSAFASGNTYGFQFHPEKSHQFGMNALKSFASL